MNNREERACDEHLPVFESAQIRDRVKKSVHLRRADGLKTKAEGQSRIGLWPSAVGPELSWPAYLRSRLADVFVIYLGAKLFFLRSILRPQTLGLGRFLHQLLATHPRRRNTCHTLNAGTELIVAHRILKRLAVNANDLISRSRRQHDGLVHGLRRFNERSPEFLLILVDQAVD